MIMHDEDNILKYNQDKILKVPLIIYANRESLIDQIHACGNNPEESSITKINKHAVVAIDNLHTAHLIAAEADLICTEILTA